MNRRNKTVNKNDLVGIGLGLLRDESMSISRSRRGYSRNEGNTDDKCYNYKTFSLEVMILTSQESVVRLYSLR